MAAPIKHYAVTCRESGATALVQVPYMRTPEDCGYSAATHDWFRLVREPGEHDRIEGGRLITCPERAARRAHDAMLNRMTRAELVEFILFKVKEHG